MRFEGGENYLYLHVYGDLDLLDRYQMAHKTQLTSRLGYESEARFIAWTTRKKLYVVIIPRNGERKNDYMYSKTNSIRPTTTDLDDNHMDQIKTSHRKQGA